MDLKSGYPYYLIKNGLCEQYDTLLSDHRVDVVILGGGISGALMAYQLAKKGIQCTVIDKRGIGLGSSSASTSLLQYEIDNPLHLLEKQIGTKAAVEAYRLCSDAIDAIKKIAEDVSFPDFKYCSSLYFAHTKSKVPYLKREFISRQNAGFDVSYLEKEAILKKFGFNAESGILSTQAAKVDAYLLSHYLHQYNQKKGVSVFENTSIEKIFHHKSGVELISSKGFKIKAKKIIYATGYEVVEQINKPIVKLASTYACVSHCIDQLPGFFEKSLLWNTADPYLYIREDNGRLIIGGRDEQYYNPQKREAVLVRKAKKLKEDFNKLFPTIEFETQFSWAGTFGSTKDGLPYIGTYDKKPNGYFALGFGGNGITFSAIAAEFIAKHIKDKGYKIPAMFGFNR
ncbi:MAG: FAD-dependent oxidoreductase [Bacteroidota bacterium]